MPSWKLSLFVRVISRRIADENRTAEEILVEYPALTDDEKAEILNTITAR